MKIFKIILALFAIILFESCEKLVQIDPPQDYLISSTVFQSNETAISATTGIYAAMMKVDYPISYNLPAYTGIYSDELDYKQTAVALSLLYKNTLIAQDAITNPFWNNGFNYIYQANAVIEGLNKANKVSANVKSQLLGEAHFIRAFWMFYLTNLYGPIPLVTNTDYTSNMKLKRSEIDVVHSQILEDLLTAKQNLTDKYVAANSVTETPDRIRPNTFVASALLARLYLQRKQFTEAAEEASRVISNTKYDLAEVALVFKRNSKEVLWQLELPIATGYNSTFEANMFTLIAKPNPVSTSLSTTISEDLLGLFSTKDKRRTTWIGAFIDNSVTPSVQYNYVSKYKTRTTLADEYTTPFRLAECYLIRAEAYANLGKIPEAIGDVDKIRTRAGIDPLSTINPTISKNALQDSITIERRRELFCEWGLRWLDIKRSSNVDDLMKSISAKKGASWKSTASVWPIPLNEVLNSGNIIKQNEGYN